MYRNIFPKIFYFRIAKIFTCVFVYFFLFNLSLAQSISPGTQPADNNSMLYTSRQEDCKKKNMVYDGSKCVSKVDGSSCIPLPYYFSLGDCVVSVANTIFTKFLEIINWFLGNLIWLASLTFDFAVYFTIVQFKTNISEMQIGGIGSQIFSNNGNLIEYLWGIIRDILNIMIFIVIIYYAVMSMFEGFTETRRRFISLLVFSIIANFSLLFVRLAIDISNILSLQAYTLAVKPKGTQNFWEFRRFNDSGVNSFGEYLMNSVDLNRLLDDKNATENVKEEIRNMKNTFMFQFGRMIVYLGLIYILLYMSGILFMRAGIFIVSMIAASLLAFDIFFKMFEQAGGGRTKEIALGIRSGITNKFRDDFYDGLIKGPLLIFSIFLIGVLAESIFSQGILNNLQSGFSQSDEASLIPSSFSNAVFVFFKFALFFVLSKLMIDKLNSMSFGTRLSSAGQGFANFALSRGIGATGWLGRNLVSRRLVNSKTGKKAMDALQRGSISLQNDTSILSPVTNRIGRGVSALEKGLRGGSYDFRRLGMDKDGKLNRLGTSAQKAAGIFGVSGVDLGKGAEGGFKTFDDRRKEKSTKIINSDIDSAVNSISETQEHRDKAQQEKTSIGPIKNASFSEIDALLKNPNFANFLEQNPNGGTSPQIQVGGNQIQVRFTKDERDLFVGMKNGEMNEYKKKLDDDRETAIKKKVQEAKDTLKHKMESEAATGKRVGTFNIVEKARDRISGRKTAGPTGSVAKGYQKAMLEYQKDNAKKDTVIKESEDILKSTIQRVDTLLNSDLLSGNERNDLIKKRKSLTDIYTKFQDPNQYKVLESDSNSERSNKVDKLKEDKDTREKIIKVTKDVSNTLVTYYESGAESDRRFNDLDTNIDNLESRIRSIKNDSSKATSPTGKALIRSVEQKLKIMKQLGKNRTPNKNDAEKISKVADSLENRYKDYFDPKVEKKDDKH